MVLIQVTPEVKGGRGNLQKQFSKREHSSQSQILRPDMFQKGLSANEGQASEG